VPVEWGRRDHVEGLLGDAFELRFEDRVSRLPVESNEAHWQLFVEHFGPVRTLAESLDDERREELHQAWVDFYDSRYGAGPSEHVREYLLVLGTRR
jgi:hypothetical protein